MKEIFSSLSEFLERSSKRLDEVVGSCSLALGSGEEGMIDVLDVRKRLFRVMWPGTKLVFNGFFFFSSFSFSFSSFSFFEFFDFFAVCFDLRRMASFGSAWA